MMVLPPLGLGDFAPFLRAVHGQDPFPWQQRLAHKVAESGWPGVLDLPTGSGKTAALDVAVFALALDAGRRPRSAPLRIVYVVDRRTIVDQAHERARRIRRALEAADADVVRRVRDRLATYTGEPVPLQTVRLRGGIARDDAWARTPDQPLIAVSTVDQAGSRLLFRGYGVSDSMKPVHAGLLGADVLYLLDEVHLSQPFRETLAAVGERYRTWAEQPLVTPFVVVEMSATPGRSALATFSLDGADRQDPRLAVRLRSSKPATLVSTNAKGFASQVEEHVLPMLARPGATIAVVVNRVRSARELHARLSDAVPDGASTVHLLTGRMRPFDRDALESGLLTRIRAGRVRSASDLPAIIVATQSIEAGADFDFDALVTECASLDALRQRFGRLDRLGELAGSARGVIVARSDSLKDDPVYGDAIGATWEWLQALTEGQVVDFGIEALVVPQDAEEQGLLAPRPHAPILLPSHLDAWVQATPISTPARPISTPDPDVALWLHGPRRGMADLQVVWRADLTEALLRQATGADDQAAHAAGEIALDMVEALPPVGAEAMSVPFLGVRHWLEGKSELESFDVEGAADAADEDDDGRDARPQAEARPVLLWQGDQSKVVAARDLVPGQTIVVPASYGGMLNGNWAPEAETAVEDVAELAALRQGRRSVLRLHPSVVRGLVGAGTASPAPAPADSETPDDRAAVLAWLDVQAPTADGEVRELLDSLLSDAKSLRVARLPLAPGDEAGEYFIVTGRRRSIQTDEGQSDEQASTEGIGSSFTGVEVPLADHLAGVAEEAARFGHRLGLPGSLVADLRLAGEWHDAGKADPRFQRWLHGGSQFKAMVQSAPLAKSRTRLTSRLASRVARERAGYPDRTRHELMSLALMDAAGAAATARAQDWTLVRYLVASHHGHCRPLAPWVPDPNPVEIAFHQGDVTSSASSGHELARLDSGVADRFWQVVRRYGWWGAAWLEAILRLADHRRSEREQRQGKSDA